MIGRRQLPVCSPISAAALVRATRDAAAGSRSDLAAHARNRIAQTFNASQVLMTDSGTSALVLALRLATRRRDGRVGTVGYPGYACVDLAAAARFAGVGVRLYDVDPRTLSPDMDSVERMLQRGVDALVIAHLFGYAADVRGISELAERFGVPVIEDAAQGAGGSLHDRRLGSLGDLTVLSFGRGKGLCAGGGGALLAHSSKWEAVLQSSPLENGAAGWSGLIKTAVQWILGRPSVYALPAMVPWLHLGEMVYHPATEPSGMVSSAHSLISAAFDLEAADLIVRRRNAAKLDLIAKSANALETVRPIAGSWPGYLRYAVRDLGRQRTVRPNLGITRPYPVALVEQPELAPALAAGEPLTPGAAEIARSLFTLPTHRFVSASDFVGLERWMTQR